MTIGNAGRDLVVYLAMMQVLEYIISSRRVVKDPSDKMRGAIVAGSMLVLVSAVKIGYEMSFKEESYYDMLDVLPGTQSSELKKGYKRASLKVHPDKVQAAGAAETGDEEGGADDAFIALKAAYDVLSDSYSRDLYNKFGKAGLEFKDDTTNLIAGLGFFYVMWLTLAYLLTRRKAVGRAQTWGFTGLLALGIFEYQACILSFDFLQDQLPQLAMFEKIELLHRLYPVYLLGARLVAWLCYEDLDAYSFVMLQHLHWKTDRMRDRVEQLTTSSPLAAAATPADAKWVSLPAPPADAPVTLQHWADFANIIAQGPAVAVGPQAGAVAAPSGGGAAAAGGAAAPAGTPPMPGSGAPAAKAAPAGGGGRNLTSLLWFFGIYFFFQWLLGRGQ